MPGLIDAFSINPGRSQPRRRPLPTWLAILQALFGLTLMTLLINLGLVLFWPDGLQLLKDTYHAEADYVRVNMDSATTQRVNDWVNKAYEWVFVKSGIHGWVYGSTESTVINGIWPMLQGIVIGFQILMIRLSIIILMLPFMLVILVVASTDGLLGWYKRRTGGMRESGFMYHRSKKFLGWGLSGLWAIYLILPIAINPALVFLPSIATTFIASRLTVQFFKKYL